MDYAIAYEAILVSPNHRLLPESTGLDIMEDLSDFWQWAQTDLGDFVSCCAAGVGADLSKILVQEESSGELISEVPRYKKLRRLRYVKFRGLSRSPIRPGAASPTNRSSDCFIPGD